MGPPSSTVFSVRNAHRAEKIMQRAPCIIRCDKCSRMVTASCPFFRGLGALPGDYFNVSFLSQLGDLLEVTAVGVGIEGENDDALPGQ